MRVIASVTAVAGGATTGGLMDTVFGMCATTWVGKRQAVLYRTKAEATRQAKMLKGNYTIKEIK